MNNIEEYVAKCPNIKDKKNRYEEKFIKDLCEDAVKALHERCLVIGSKSLSNYNQLERVNSCKNKYFMKAYKEIVVKAIILPALGNHK